MLYPLNRYLVVEPCLNEDKQDKSTILVPDDVKIDVEPFKVVKLIKAHEDSTLWSGCCLVVPSHSLEHVSIDGQAHHIVLESHVVARVEL